MAKSWPRGTTSSASAAQYVLLGGFAAVAAGISAQGLTGFARSNIRNEKGIEVFSGARRVAYVWDLSQTTGQPLPAQITTLTPPGEVPPGLWDCLCSAVVGTNRLGDSPTQARTKRLPSL